MMPACTSVARVLLFAITVLTPVLTAAEDPASVTIHHNSATLSATELADLFGAYVEKFSVVAPDDATHLEASLSLRHKGQDHKQFGPGISQPVDLDRNRKGELLIALIPVNGTLTDAETVKVTVSLFGLSSMAVKENPFRGQNIAKSIEHTDDGAVNLIGGYAGQTGPPPLALADTVLSLKVVVSKK